MPVYALGDIHGDWDSIYRIIERVDMSNCTLISVGDIGIGFLDAAKQERQNIHVNNFFKSKNIEFLGIRGNHDDPSYFTGDVSYSHFKLLADYTTLILEGKRFLFVGGALSIDRSLRKEGISYWKDESLKLDYKQIIKCDILITHSAPSWSGPLSKPGLVSSLAQKDPTIWDECMEERKQHDILIKLSNPSRHYCGHFHEYSVVDFDDCVSSILDINQIVEISL